jgi:hypothetical protein
MNQRASDATAAFQRLPSELAKALNYGAAMTEDDWVKLAALWNANVRPPIRQPLPDDDFDVVMNPRRWTRQMNDAWHKNIPDLQAAFDALKVLYRRRDGDVDMADKIASNVLANFKTEGNRNKYDELEACYAMLFKQLQPIAKLCDRMAEALERIASYPDANTISDAHYIARKTAREALAQYRAAKDAKC